PVTPLRELLKNMELTRSKAVMFYDVLVKDERELTQTSAQLIRCSIADYVSVRKPVYAMYANASSKRIKTALKYSDLIRNETATDVVGEENDAVCYMHSGGTSGIPKIVKLSNYAFNSTATTILDMYHTPCTNNNFYLATLPIFHAYGLCVDIHTGLTGGFNLAIVPKFDPKAVMAYIKKYNTTVWSVVPAMMLKMLKSGKFKGRRLSKMDVVFCGGDSLPESLVEKVDAVFKKYGSRAQLMRGYGLTETCGVCMVNNYDDYAKHSCGKPIDGCQVEICDENGNALPCGERGEITLTARGLMLGYLEGGESFTKDGSWIKTGDIGYKDENGFVYVVDRKKRMIKIAAVNVFPSEVEECIKLLPFVDEACVVPYKKDGKQYLKAFVTVNGKTTPNDVSDAVIAHCKANLIKYSVPYFVEVLDVMPRTKLAKVDYKQLENR
ncbi:MAG: fatty acid--CoA ligase family protein, partial [Firmicutes bacterium]|nr:fatty acid--CoA ligase family protein [Bacillota bacterium]